MSSVNSMARGVSTAIIIVIVIIVVSCLASIAVAIWLWVRSRRRRQARLAGFEALGTNHTAYDNSNNGYYQPPMATPSPYMPESSNQNELHGSSPPFRAEAPDTPAPLPQAPNNEIEIKKPHDNSRAELYQPEPLRPVQSSQPTHSAIKPSELPG